MSMDWFRWYHGTVCDPKLSLIARKSSQSRSTVIAVWAALLEHASQANPRGDIAGFDAETVAVALDIDDAAIHSIIAAMTAKGMITDDRITAWDKRQPQREYLDSVSPRPSPEIWKVMRQRIFERDDFTCQYCGVRGAKLECDHVVPVSRGGSGEDTNLATACFSCNRSKRDKLIEEWMP